MAMGQWESVRAGRRIEPSARDAEFGLYVGKARKRAKPFLLGAAPDRVPLDDPLDDPAERPALLRSVLARRPAAMVAAAAAALLTGVAVGKLENPVEISLASHSARASLARPADPGGESRRLAVASTIVAAPSAKTPLQVQIASPQEVPANSFVRVRGLPPAASLSEGYAMGPGAWAVPVAALSRLNMKVADWASGTANVGITLVSSGGETLAEATTVLVIGPTPTDAPAAAAPRFFDAKADRQPARQARYQLGKPAPTASRDVPLRVAAPDRPTRKRSVWHVVKQRQQLATRAPKTKNVTKNVRPPEPPEVVSWVGLLLPFDFD
jgi:hypothetical protein